MARCHAATGEDRVAIRSQHGVATQRTVHHPRLQVTHGANATVWTWTNGVGSGARSVASQLLGHLSHAADRIKPLVGHGGVGVLTIARGAWVQWHVATVVRRHSTTWHVVV